MSTHSRQRSDDDFGMIHSLDEIPVFADEQEEADWWDTHDFSDELWEELRQRPPTPDVRAILRHVSEARRTDTG
jgi:hypothetical protein